MTCPDFIHPKYDIEEFKTLILNASPPKKKKSPTRKYSHENYDDRIGFAWWFSNLYFEGAQPYDPDYSSMAIEYAYLTEGLSGAEDVMDRMVEKFSKIFKTDGTNSPLQFRLNAFKNYESPMDSTITAEISLASECYGPSFKGFTKIYSPDCDEDFYERCFEKLDSILKEKGCDGVLGLLNPEVMDLYNVPDTFSLLYPVSRKWTATVIDRHELVALIHIMVSRIDKFLNPKPRDKTTFPIFDEAIRLAYEDSKNKVPRPQEKRDFPVKSEYVDVFPDFKKDLPAGASFIIHPDCYLGESNSPEAPPLVPYTSFLGDMDEHQRDFYDYWKSKFEQGIFLNVLEMYLYPYVDEITHSDLDESLVIDRLQILSDRYWIDLDGRIIDYATRHDIDEYIWENHPQSGMSRIFNPRFLNAISADTIKPVDRDAIIFFMECLSIDTDCPVFTFPLINDALIAFDNYSKENGYLRISDIVKSMKQKNGGRKVLVKDIDILDYLEISLFFTHVITITLKTAYGKVGHVKPTVPRSNVLKEQRQFLTDFANAWLEHKYHSYGFKEDSRSKLKNLSRPILDYVSYGETTVVLDKDHISKATKDLEAVVSMMASEDVSESANPIRVFEAVKKSEGEGWDAFFDEIGDSGKQYLIQALNGTARAYCSENKLKLNSVESKINNAAMDIIGDAIVQNGEVIEEYIDNIKSIVT